MENPVMKVQRKMTKTQYRILAAALIVVAFFIGIYVANYRARQTTTALKAAYLAEQDKLIVLSQDRAEKLKEIQGLKNELASLQKTNDQKIKEAGVSAYRKTIVISDDSVNDAWAAYMRGVRERNRKRDTQ